MLGRGEVGWSRISVPMSDAACEFFPEVGSRDYSSSIVANSRSSLYLRNMVELVVDFTRDTLLVVNSSETCTIRAEYHTLILIISFVGALTGDGQEVRGCHWTTNRFEI